MNPRRFLRISTLFLLCFAIVACAPLAQPVIPTDAPTQAPTFTPSASPTVGAVSFPTLTPAAVSQNTGGATATPLLGATRTPAPDDFPTATRPFDPNAPRIDFFTSDILSVAPGGDITLFWSTRNVDAAVIYRLESDGTRSQVYNVVPDGNLTIATSNAQRGTLRFALAIGEGSDYTEDILVVPLECPDEWFFVPAPPDCADDEAVSTQIIDMSLERGRMLFVEESNLVYALFNDGLADRPAWLSFLNQYNPEIHQSRDPNAPPEWIQPVNELGYVWRTNEDVRTRLGLGLADAIAFEGLIQTSSVGGTETIYISGSNGVVLQLEPSGDIWQIITQ
ncbi:MAG: hypothetical protein AAFR81_29830 [Chloroflexota bacterium]